MTTQQTHYFTQENVRAYYLEYDSERAGSFVLLEKVSEDKLVVLDFDEATRYLPLDRLCLSPQCGFASTEEENVLFEEQWKKFLLSKALQKKFG